MRYKPQKYCKIEGCNGLTIEISNLCRPCYLENKRMRYHKTYKYIGTGSLSEQLKEEKKQLGFI